MYLGNIDRDHEGRRIDDNSNGENPLYKKLLWDLMTCQKLQYPLTIKTFASTIKKKSVLLEATLATICVWAKYQLLDDDFGMSFIIFTFIF